MNEKSLADLDPRLQKQLNEAVVAINNGSISYAINVSSGVLLKHPEAYEARIILWKAVQLKRGSVGGVITRLIGSVRGKVFKLFIGNILKKDPMEAIRQCDECLAKGSVSGSHCEVLMLVSELLAWKETVVSCAAMLVDLDPKNVRYKLKYGRALLRNGQAEAAVEQAESALLIQPSNVKAIDLLKDASIAGAVQKSNWESSESILDKLKK